MPKPKDGLKDRLSRYRQIKISVIGRKSGQTISIPVWFVLEGEKLYLLPVQGSDSEAPPSGDTRLPWCFLNTHLRSVSRRQHVYRLPRASRCALHQGHKIVLAGRSVQNEQGPTGVRATANARTLGQASQHHSCCHSATRCLAGSLETCHTKVRET